MDRSLVIENIADTTSFDSGEAALSRPITPTEGENPPGAVVISNMEMVTELDSFIDEVGELKKESEKTTHGHVTNDDGFDTKLAQNSQEIGDSTFHREHTMHRQETEVERFVSPML